MDINEILKYPRDDLGLILNKLKKIPRVVYSGSIHGLINKVDYKKITDTSKHLNPTEHGLMEELKVCREKLEK